MGSFSIWHLLILLVIVLVIFGTKRLTGGAKDVADAVKEFKKAMSDDSGSKKTDPIQPAIDASRPPADVTRVERPPPPPAAPGDDTLPRG
jgi:sec-independent protein translocase protein TatA